MQQDEFALLLLLNNKSLSSAITRYFAQLEPASLSQYRLDTDFNPAGSFEISMDFMVTDTAIQQWLYSRWPVSNVGVSIAIRVNSNRVEFFVSGDGTNSSSVSLPLVGNSVWHRLTVVFLSANTLIIALNGVVASKETTIPAPFASPATGYIGSKDSAERFVDGMIKNPKFKDLSSPVNNQEYLLGLASSNTEFSLSGNSTLSYLNIAPEDRELYEFDNVSTWRNISPPPKLLPALIQPKLLPALIQVAPVEQEVRDIILLIGQSNMIGRYGPIDPILDATNTNIKMYGVTLQEVVVAADPLDHFNEHNGDVGLGLTLAKSYKPASGNEILLIPSAKGGSGFQDGFWLVGGAGYNMAVTRSYEATLMGNGTNKVAMIAWHQGENESSWSELQYADAIDTLINSMRSIIPTADNAPFIVGEISPSSNAYGSGVAAALLDTPNRHTKAGYVATSDLALGGDNLHFTAASCRTMGERYNAVFESI